MHIDPLLVFTVGFVVVLLAIILLINSRIEKRKQKRGFSMTLPEGWYHVPGATPLEYHPPREGGGVLQISLNPPFEQKITTGEDAEKKLVELVGGFSMDVGKRIALDHEQAVPGIMATATYESDDDWYSFWLIPTEVTVLGTYITSKGDEAGGELAQAAEIMRTVEFR
jgi:hypothetical protein